MLKLPSPTIGTSAPCTPNLLPCRIYRDSPVDASPRYWAPSTAADGKLETYFRGRKLRGKEIRVPEGYRGVIVKGDEAERGTDMKNERRMQREEDEEGEVEPKTLREVGSFNEIVLWGHESVVDGDDAFVKGLGEWVGFAEAVVVDLVFRQMHRAGEANGS
ncbi:hypothetical protein MMC28_004657 [Mycoblastus sanguinarius]|nr:hypothetical protein [Mycoblastus sanguinarius]